jgi:hypothetical protein
VRLGLERAKAYLTPELRSRVISQSGPSRVKNLAPRSTEVERSVAEHRPDCWLIIDDDFYGWSRESQFRLVLCDAELGLGDDAALARLRELLTRMYS